MEAITLGEIVTALLTAASALVLLSNAAEKITAAVRAAKAPEKQQTQRIDRLEDDVKSIKIKLGSDKQHLDDIETANRVTQEALLALLEHGLNGNNVEPMTKAKDKLQNYLINH